MGSNLGRHVNPAKFPLKSKFFTFSKSEVLKMVNRALDGQTGDGIYYYQFPSAIGRTASGEDQFFIRVVVRGGKLITAFPSGPPS